MLRDCYTLRRPTSVSAPTDYDAVGPHHLVYFDGAIDIIVLTDKYIPPVIDWLRTTPDVFCLIRYLELTNISFEKGTFTNRYFLPELKVDNTKPYVHNKKFVAFLISLRNLKKITFTEQTHNLRQKVEHDYLWWQKCIEEFFHRRSQFFEDIPDVELRRCNWMLSWKTLAEYSILPRLGVDWLTFWAPRSTTRAVEEA